MQGQLDPPTQPRSHGQQTLPCLLLPTLGHRGPRPGSACAPQPADVWPSPNLVSLPKRLPALMRYYCVISVGKKNLKQEVQQVISLFYPEGWLTICCDVIIDKILTVVIRHSNTGAVV